MEGGGGVVMQFVAIVDASAETWTMVVSSKGGFMTIVVNGQFSLSIQRNFLAKFRNLNTVRA